jgi:hypothetical protein
VLEGRTSHGIIREPGSWGWPIKAFPFPHVSTFILIFKDVWVGIPILCYCKDVSNKFWIWVNVLEGEWRFIASQEISECGEKNVGFEVKCLAMKYHEVPVFCKVESLSHRACWRLNKTIHICIYTYTHIYTDRYRVCACLHLYTNQNNPLPYIIHSAYEVNPKNLSQVITE